MKICPVGAELSHEDGRTDGSLADRKTCRSYVVSFLNLANAPTNKKKTLFVTQFQTSYQQVSISCGEETS
jgi:hypothetical protein